MTIRCQAALDIDMRETLLAKKEHLWAISEIEKSIFAEPWTKESLELFLSENNFCVVCTEADTIASYCTVLTVLDEAQIANIATESAFRGKGFACDVLERVILECQNRNLSMISLEVRESNAPAITLYQKLGFEIAGKRNNFYKNPRENALVMIKNLV